MTVSAEFKEFTVINSMGNGEVSRKVLPRGNVWDKSSKLSRSRWAASEGKAL